MKSLKIKYLWLLLVLLLPVLCFAEKCPGFNIREYKPDESCGDLERKCCISKSYYDMGEWSDWGGECASCTPGEYWKLPCSFYYNDPNYYGWEAFTCNSDSKWEAYTPATSCVPPVYVQFRYALRLDSSYRLTSNQNCTQTITQPVLLKKPDGAPFADFNIKLYEDANSEIRIITDVIPLVYENYYAYPSGYYACFSREESDGMHYYPLHLYARTFYSTSLCTSGINTSSRDNPYILEVGGALVR